jgi:hypothetical protein
MSGQQLWMSRIAEGIEVRAVIHYRHAQQDSGALFSAELRITKNDRLLLREWFFDERKLYARSMQAFRECAAAKRRNLAHAG